MEVFHDFHASSKFEKVLMPFSLFLFQRNLGLLILRTFGLLVLCVEFTRLLPKS
jgi:hypothetical protein